MQQRLAEQELVQEEDELSFDATPVCGGNYSTPVVDLTYYLEELRYQIGNRTYVTNAD